MLTRVAYRYLVALSQAEEAAINVFKGIPPDGNPWHGDKPKISVSYSGAETFSLETRGNQYKATIGVVPRIMGGEGVYANSHLFFRFQQAYPMGAPAMNKVWGTVLQKEMPRLKRDIKEHWEGSFKSYLPDVVWGFREAEEWESPTDVKVTDIQIEPIPWLTRHPSEINARWAADVTFNAVKKAPITGRGVFVEMSDRDLNALIQTWESYSPEEFWMDGELQLTGSQAMAYYRKQWRQKSPREQAKLYAWLKENTR